MKKIIVLLLAITPIITQAQTADVVTPKPKIQPAKWEVSGNWGHAETTHDFDMEACIDMMLTGGFAVYRNFNGIQLGLGVDGGSLPEEYADVTPTVIVNKTFDFGTNNRLYGYIGVNGGYVARWHNQDYTALNNTWSHGYVVGAQTGMVINICERIAVNMELGVRRAEYNNTTNVANFENDHDHAMSDAALSSYIHPTPQNVTFREMHFPKKLGVRIRL